jgi:predicted small metal-binding protein
VRSLVRPAHNVSAIRSDAIDRMAAAVNALASG